MTYDKQTSIIFIEAYLYQNQKMKFSGISLKFGDLFSQNKISPCEKASAVPTENKFFSADWLPLNQRTNQNAADTKMAFKSAI